jgi:hypothetical protein
MDYRDYLPMVGAIAVIVFVLIAKWYIKMMEDEKELE